MLDNFSRFCYRLLTFFKINFFKKILSGTVSECQTVWIQISTDAMSVNNRVISPFRNGFILTKLRIWEV